MSAPEVEAPSDLVGGDDASRKGRRPSPIWNLYSRPPNSSRSAAACLGCSRRVGSGNARRMLAHAIKCPHLSPEQREYAAQLAAQANVSVGGGEAVHVRRMFAVGEHTVAGPDGASITLSQASGVGGGMGAAHRKGRRPTAIWDLYTRESEKRESSICVGCNQRVGSGNRRRMVQHSTKCPKLTPEQRDYAASLAGTASAELSDAAAMQASSLHASGAPLSAALQKSLDSRFVAAMRASGLTPSLFETPQWRDFFIALGWAPPPVDALRAMMSGRVKGEGEEGMPPAGPSAPAPSVGIPGPPPAGAAPPAPRE